MRQWFRPTPALDDRAALLADALGVLALFVLLLVALHLPMLS
ncbi:MAG: hypothetical protein ACK4LQ_08950 [Pararhodobacter sp.]